MLLSGCLSSMVEDTFQGSDDGSLHLYNLRTVFIGPNREIRLNFEAPDEHIALCLPETDRPLRASKNLCEDETAGMRKLDILESGDVLTQFGIIITKKHYRGFGYFDDGGEEYSFLEFSDVPQPGTIVKVFRFPLNRQADQAIAWAYSSPIFLVNERDAIFRLDYDAEKPSDPGSPNRSLTSQAVAQLPPGVIQQEFHRVSDMRLVSITSGSRNAGKRYLLSDPTAPQSENSHIRPVSVTNPQSDSDRRLRAVGSCLYGPALVVDIILFPVSIVYVLATGKKCFPM